MIDRSATEMLAHLRSRTIGLALVGLAGCATSPGTRAEGGGDAAPACVSPRFGSPEAVTLLNYTGDAMEPFVTRDGALLFFNDSNEPGRDTQLHVATRVDALTFRHEGELVGANSSVLDGVASVASGTLYFVSTRSYATTLGTVYRAELQGRSVSSVELVPGVSRGRAGWVNFDAEITASGERMYLVDGLYDSPSMGWKETALVVAARGEDGVFSRTASTELAAVQWDGGIEYAPSTSADERTLYVTRFAKGTAAPRIFVATRPSASDPFCAPREVAEAEGFVEAATVAPDGSIYYHRRDDDGVFRLKHLPVAP
jgi:hypothetical protein